MSDSLLPQEKGWRCGQFVLAVSNAEIFCVLLNAEEDATKVLKRVELPLDPIPLFAHIGGCMGRLVISAWGRIAIALHCSMAVHQWQFNSSASFIHARLTSFLERGS
jgi:hypothetical protein